MASLTLCTCSSVQVIRSLYRSPRMTDNVFNDTSTSLSKNQRFQKLLFPKRPPFDTVAIISGMGIYRRNVVGGGEGDDDGGIADNVAETSDLSALLCRVLSLLLLSPTNPQSQPKCGVYPPPEELGIGRGVDVALELCLSSI